MTPDQSHVGPVQERGLSPSGASHDDCVLVLLQKGVELDRVAARGRTDGGSLIDVLDRNRLRHSNALDGRGLLKRELRQLIEFVLPVSRCRVLAKKSEDGIDNVGECRPQIDRDAAVAHSPMLYRTNPPVSRAKPEFDEGCAALYQPQVFRLRASALRTG